MEFEKQFTKSVITTVAVGIKEAQVKAIAEDRPLVLARAMRIGASTLASLEWSDEEDIFDATKYAEEIEYYLESNGYDGRAARMTKRLTKDLQEIVDSIRV